MKIFKIFTVAALSLSLLSCGDRDLPYDLDGVTKGVAIDIRKTKGSDLVLADGSTAGTYSVELRAAKYQGDMSMFKEAQVLCVYTPAGSSVSKSVVAVNGITSLPATATINLASVCSALGITAPAIGDKMVFTPNVILTNDFLVPGWSELGGYNNTYFSGWEMGDGTYFNNRVTYAAYAPFVETDYQGTIVCDESGSPYNVTVTPITDAPPTIADGFTAADYYGMEVDGIWDTGCKAKIWVNKKDFSVVVPNQVINPAWVYSGTPQELWIQSVTNAEINTSTKVISFTTQIYMTGLGGWSGINYSLQF